MLISKSLKSGYSARNITREWGGKGCAANKFSNSRRPCQACTDCQQSKSKVNKTTTKPTKKSIRNQTENFRHMSSFLPQEVQQHNQKYRHLLAEVKVNKTTKLTTKKCPHYNWQFQVHVLFFAARGATTQPKRQLPPHWEDQCSVVAHIALPKEIAGRCVPHPLCPCHPHPGPAVPHVPCTRNAKEYL